MAHSAKYFPRHPKKYAGNPSGIVYRSNWERTFMIWCDTNPSVVRWASEELAIPYYFLNPTKGGKWHRYFPDFVVSIKTDAGPIETWIVEIKPHRQTLPPTGTGKSRRMLKEAIEYGRNQAKWEAATAFCKRKGWRFVILTEHHLYPKP